uniref:Tumor necrosis factor receptor superfamily, member 9 n=1 Tax=Nannospalax galili TaxID=1026970 RepID=A0A8C6R5V2_NANGA
MGNNCYNLVVTVLLVVSIEGVRTQEDPCEKCEAGTFCKKNNRACAPCPSSTYSSTGGQRYCNHCTKCEGNFRVKKPCSRTSNAECDCIPGYHCLGANCSRCEEDCKEGQELTKDGCKDCPFGTFNNLEGGGSCGPWTNCSLDGKSVHRNGTKNSDVVCGPTSAGGQGHSPQVLTILLALTLATLLFLLLFVILRLSMVKWSRKKFLNIFKQPFKTPMAQEEDACSCRFPEEEEGGSL